MKVAVCVKEVPDAATPRRLDPTTLRLDRSGEGAVNPWDLPAVEEGLKLVESLGGEVVVVSMGPERALTSLRRTLAMGVDRAALLTDEAAQGSDLLATSLGLAKLLEREAADLVLFGQQGSDSDGAVLWAAVADRLKLPLVSQAAGIEVGDGKVTVRRQTEYGYDVIEAPLPCIVAVSDAINEPRYPSLKGIMGAKKKQQESLSAGDLGIESAELGESGSRTEVYAVAKPPSRGQSTVIEDDGSGAERVVEFLAERKLL